MGEKAQEQDETQRKKDLSLGGGVNGEVGGGKTLFVFGEGDRGKRKQGHKKPLKRTRRNDKT